MALLDEELMPFFGNPNIQRQGARARALAAQRDVNTLPDPRTYAVISGLLGQAPDEMGFSVLNPDYEGIQRVARPAFAAGTALGVAPMMRAAGFSRPAAKAATAKQQLGILAPKGFRGKPLEGLPEAVEVNGRMDPFGTDQRIVDIAGRYMADKGITYQPQRIYAPLDVDRATRLANAFEKMKHTPTDKKTQKAYKALAKETQDQYEALLKAGYKFDFIRGADPYGNPRNAINDVIANKRMSVFPTDQGFGGPSAAAVDISGNPLMARSDLRIANDPNTTYNDLFRAVHDVFGHAKHGVGFRARGEENAFQAHARMYSPEALPAAASETRGQNSWVNFGPYGKQNQTASPSATEYAAQKTGLLPKWAYEEGLLSDWLWPQGVYRGR
jgi:hypothetical protein